MVTKLYFSPRAFDFFSRKICVKLQPVTLSQGDFAASRDEFRSPQYMADYLLSNIGSLFFCYSRLLTYVLTRTDDRAQKKTHGCRGLEPARICLNQP